MKSNLSKGKSKRALKKNVSTLINEGNTPGKAYKMAKDVQRTAIKRSTLTEVKLSPEDLIKIITEVLAEELAARGLVVDGETKETNG